MVLNEWGEIAKQCWLEIPMHFANMVLDEYVIMPNHIHGIIIVDRRGRACRAPTHSAPLQDMRKNTSTIEQFGKPTHGSIPTIIRSYKSAVTRHINQKQNISGRTLWQRNYYEHIIRDEEELNQIREYITNNPLKWGWDENNPAM